MKLPNYIPASNPYQLAGPPLWFQRALWEFDPSLAIVASKQGFFYRLAQRRPLKLKENIVNDVLKEQADTRLLASHGLIPVTTILATVNWSNPVFFEELRRRAPWRMGGAERFTKLVEDQDWKELKDKAVVQDEHLTSLAKDSWKYYNMKQGLRSSVFSHTTKGNKTHNVSPSLFLPRKPYSPEVTSTWIDVKR